MCWSCKSSVSTKKKKRPTKSPTMNEKRRVAVYDIEKKDLSKLPLTEFPAEDFAQLRVPRFGRFDIYASNEDVIDSESNSADEVAYDTPRHPRSVAVVTKISQDTKGMSFRARVNFGGLGHFTNVKRVFSSRSRVLYVGAIPT